jgi:hypothetical protein
MLRQKVIGRNVEREENDGCPTETEQEVIWEAPGSFPFDAAAVDDRG